MDEGGFGDEAEHFEEARLDAVGGGVDFVHAEVGLADAIAEFFLSHGRFDDAQNRISDLLRVAGGVCEERGHFGRNVIGQAVGLAAGLVGGINDIAKDRGPVCAGLDDDGFNALGSKFIAIGFRQRFHGEFAGGVEREGGNDDTAMDY